MSILAQAGFFVSLPHLAMAVGCISGAISRKTREEEYSEPEPMLDSGVEPPSRAPDFTCFGFDAWVEEERIIAESRNGMAHRAWIPYHDRQNVCASQLVNDRDHAVFNINRAFEKRMAESTGQ